MNFYDLQELELFLCKKNQVNMRPVFQKVGLFRDYPNGNKW